MRAQWIHLAFGLVCVWGALTLVGCGDSGPQTIPVTGTVTLDGTAVPDANVVFVASDGTKQSAAGVTDAQGKYTLNCAAGAGALAGKYNVGISKKNKEDMEKASAAAAAAEGASSDSDFGGGGVVAVRDVIPSKYAVPTTSELTATVSADEIVHDFDLKSK